MGQKIRNPENSGYPPDIRYFPADILYFPADIRQISGGYPVDIRRISGGGNSNFPAQVWSYRPPPTATLLPVPTNGERDAPATSRKIHPKDSSVGRISAGYPPDIRPPEIGFCPLMSSTGDSA